MATRKQKATSIEMWQVWLTTDTAIVGMRYTSGPVDQGQNVVRQNEVRIGPNILGIVETGRYSDVVHRAYRWVGRGSAAHIASLVKGYVESYALDVSQPVRKKTTEQADSYTVREIDGDE